MADMFYGSEGAPEPDSAPGKATLLMNGVAAVVSVGLVIGVAVWGYKLVMRDVSGVPVVRAMQGEMRLAPENPGGEIAAHTGLSVNDVPAEGGAAKPEDRLVLAPRAPDLPAEDLAVVPTAEAAEIAPVDAANEEMTAAVADAEAVEATPVAATDPVDPNRPLSAEDILALADQIAAGAEPMEQLQAEGVPEVQVSVGSVTATAGARIDATIPGVNRSLRPSLRPIQAVATATAQAAVAATVTQSSAEASEETVALTGALPSGTKLVQLGAYDSPEIAAREWTRIAARYADFMDGKERVIQEATSGGRTFYRLRAMGFADLPDARRFCSAIVAQNGECIPVVVR